MSSMNIRNNKDFIEGKVQIDSIVLAVKMALILKINQISVFWMQILYLLVFT